MKKKVLAMMIASIMSITLLAGCGSNTTSSEAEPEETKEEVTATQSTITEEATTEGSTPRNETLYFNGQQWGTINNFNPMSSNSNNAMAVQQVDSARVLIYETLFLYNMLDGSLQPLLGDSYE